MHNIGKIKEKYLFILFLLFSSSAILFALFTEYLGYSPCKLCIFQRIPHYFIISISLISLLIIKNRKFLQTNLIICTLLLVTNIVLSFYHIGVEKKIFQGPTNCSSEISLNEITNSEDLRSELSKIKAVRCDIPSFVFLGLSMTSWHFIYCLTFFINLIIFRKFTTYDK